MVSDKTIKIKQKPLKIFFSSHYLPKLYIGFIVDQFLSFTKAFSIGYKVDQCAVPGTLFLKNTPLLYSVCHSAEFQELGNRMVQ